MVNKLTFSLKVRENLHLWFRNLLLDSLSKLGGIQQLRGQNFANFLPLPSCVDSFYTLSVDKNRHFLTPSLLRLVHVVIEWPLTNLN